MSTISGEFKDCGSIVRYSITEEMQREIIKKLLTYYENTQHSGEGINQCDDAIIEAPNVLSDICDNIIKFKTDYLDE